MQRRRTPQRSRAKVKGSILLFSFIGVICATGWIFQNSLIASTAGLLIHSDPPAKSDLIVVLGGNFSVRAPAAAQLYREGWAPKILLAREPHDPIGHGGESFTDVTTRILESQGVPKDRIVDFAPANGVTSTADEVRAIKLFASVYPLKSILVVTSSFHSARAERALRRALPSSVDIRMIAADDPSCTAENWRYTPLCQHQVKLEWIKGIYYFLTFWG